MGALLDVKRAKEPVLHSNVLRVIGTTGSVNSGCMVAGLCSARTPSEPEFIRVPMLRSLTVVFRQNPIHRRKPTDTSMRTVGDVLAEQAFQMTFIDELARFARVVSRCAACGR